MNQLIVFGGSIVAVLVLALVARLLGLGRGARIASEAEARDTAEALISGFESAATLLAEDGRAALVHGRAGDAALLKIHGARIAARHLHAPLAATAAPEGLRVDSGDARFGTVTLKGVAAL